jgi:DNA (cytosine-5)-methyltransferase 1
LEFVQEQYMTPFHKEKASYPKKKNKRTPVCIDLFCGAGGLSLGFAQAGGLSVAAIDNDPASMVTYRDMFPLCPIADCTDIESWQPKIKTSNIDVIIGGPPCQGFSLARGLRFVDDPRNHLYKDFIRIVDRYKPEWVVMENVQGITNIGGGVILRQIYEDFLKIGYWVECKVINTADYGIPQTRKRAIFVGSRTKDHFDWPERTHAPRHKCDTALSGDKEPYVSVRDALSDLPWPLGKYFSHRANSQMRGPRNRSLDTEPAFTLRVRGDEFAICDMPATGAFAPAPVPTMEFVYRPATTAFQKMMREEPPAWISNLEPAPVRDFPQRVLSEPRRLSVREQARLQTFPDWFKFSGTGYAQGRQIGNAVPPLFAKKLFSEIFRQSINNGEAS